MSLVLQLYSQYRDTISHNEILYILDQIIHLANLPYPTESLDMFLKLLIYIAQDIANLNNNKQKLFFLEFVEKCIGLKDQGLVEENLMKKVVDAMSIVQYNGYDVCL